METVTGVPIEERWWVCWEGVRPVEFESAEQITELLKPETLEGAKRYKTVTLVVLDA